MNKFLLALLICLCVAGICPAQDQPKSTTMLLAKVFDHKKDMSFRLLTSADYKTLQSEIAEENRAFRKALVLAEKAWKDDEGTKKKTFPKSAIAPRKVTLVSTFTDRKKAESKLDQYQSQIRQKEEKDKEREDAKLQRMGKDKVDKENEKDAARNSLLNQAVSLFESALATVVKPVEKGEGKEEVKKEEEKKNKEEAADKLLDRM